LHASANAATEMDGQLTAYEHGPGRGATFVLEIPLQATRSCGAARMSARSIAASCSSTTTGASTRTSRRSSRGLALRAPQLADAKAAFFAARPRSKC
jgi:hypothetical protein